MSISNLKTRIDCMKSLPNLDECLLEFGFGNWFEMCYLSSAVVLYTIKGTNSPSTSTCEEINFNMNPIFQFCLKKRTSKEWFSTLVELIFFGEESSSRSASWVESNFCFKSVDPTSWHRNAQDEIANTQNGTDEEKSNWIDELTTTFSFGVGIFAASCEQLASTKRNWSDQRDCSDVCALCEVCFGV